MKQQQNSLVNSIAILSLGFAAYAQQATVAIPEPTKQPPLWKVDLRKLGAPEFFRRATPSLTFTDAGHIALSWVTVDKAQQKAPGPKPTHFNVLAFDATNRTKHSEYRSDEIMPLRFFGLPDGKFLLCTGESLKLLSADFKPVLEKDVNAPGYSCEALSPDSRFLLLSDRVGTRFENHVFDVQSLQVSTSWITDHSALEISGEWVLESCPQPTAQGTDQATCIRKLEEAQSSVVGNNATFVSDEVLVTFAPKKVSTKRGLDARLEEDASGQLMSVSSVSGDRLFRAELPKQHLFGGQPTTAQNRFAIRECRLRGLTIPDLDLYSFCSDERVIVYSILDRRAIWSLELEGTSPWYPAAGHANRLALSPDGKLMAVLTNDELRLYKLPD